MKAWMLAPMIVIAGCASTERVEYAIDETSDPYPIEPQTVTVHFLDAEEWRARAVLEMLRGAWGLPSEIEGIAEWEENGDGKIVDCEIFLPAGEAPTRHVLAHELRHCSEGAFHK